MNTSISRNRSLLAAAIGAALMFGAVAPASAQSAMDRLKERREQREQREREQEGRTEQDQSDKYPQATREPAGEARASGRMSRKLQQMVDLYDEEKGAEARTIADEVIADEDANPYSKSFAAQLAAQIAYEGDDTQAAKAYLQQALEFDGLDNNAHYNTMMMLAQLQLQDEQYEQALATIDRFLDETKSQDPDHLVLKGNALYRMERYPEAAVVLEQAIAASPEPQPSWTQMLMATYFESGQEAKAAELAEQLGNNNPNDKRAQLNLAAVYQQSDQLGKAAEVLEKLRAAGLFTEDRDYRLLYSAYLNLEGKEAQAAEVINEGLSKGVLEPDYQSWLALAQAYYFSDQIDPAIDAYRKAAPLDEDGGTYLNLARVLWQEDRIGEAKEAARQALAKGLDDPEDAKKIIALPGG